MNSRALLLWVGGFIGVGLLYAAYKGQLNPIKAVSASLSGANPSGVAGKSADATPLVNGVAGAAPASNKGAIGNSIVQSSDVWYVADQYGNPLTPIDGVYQGMPANFIPNTQAA